MILQDFNILKILLFPIRQRTFSFVLSGLESIKTGWEGGIVNTPGIEPGS